MLVIKEQQLHQGCPKTPSNENWSIDDKVDAL